MSTARNIEVIFVNQRAPTTTPVVPELMTLLSYILLVISLITGIGVISKQGWQAFKKVNDNKRKKSIEEQKIIRNQRTDPQLCTCHHKYKNHIIASENTLRAIFPTITNIHVCMGIALICLVRPCRSEFILLRDQSVLQASKETITHSVNFNFLPPREETNNTVWDLGYIASLIGIKIQRVLDCKHAHRTPTAFRESTSWSCTTTAKPVGSAERSGTTSPSATAW